MSLPCLKHFMNSLSPTGWVPIFSRPSKAFYCIALGAKVGRVGRTHKWRHCIKTIFSLGNTQSSVKWGSCGFGWTKMNSQFLESHPFKCILWRQKKIDWRQSNKFWNSFSQNVMFIGNMSSRVFFFVTYLCIHPFIHSLLWSTDNYWIPRQGVYRILWYSLCSQGKADK